MPKLKRLSGQMGMYWTPVSEEDRIALEGCAVIECKTDKQRTNKQNNALHKFLSDLAQTLNDAGLDQRVVLKPEVEIPWTPDSAKNQLWRPIQKIMTGHESTVDPTTKDYLAIQETLIRHLSSKFGVVPEWPCIETQMRKQA
jgi:hypothetical protein